MESSFVNGFEKTAGFGNLLTGLKALGKSPALKEGKRRLQLGLKGLSKLKQTIPEKSIPRKKTSLSDALRREFQLVS